MLRILRLTHDDISPHKLFFFFLIIRPPSRSTLFPYTTLFRSHPSPRPRRLLWTKIHSSKLWGRLVPRLCADRKSTRLNSSHANISYAVFCLKKKDEYPFRSDGSGKVGKSGAGSAWRTRRTDTV